jgi:hypothetical protein
MPIKKPLTKIKEVVKKMCEPSFAGKRKIILKKQKVLSNADKQIASLDLKLKKLNSLKPKTEAERIKKATLKEKLISQQRRLYEDKSNLKFTALYKVEQNRTKIYYQKLHDMLTSKQKLEIQKLKEDPALIFNDRTLYSSYKFALKREINLKNNAVAFDILNKSFEKIK